MGNVLLKTGDQWGRMTCTQVEEVCEKLMAKDAQGRDYEVGISENYFKYHLLCECGKEFSLKADSMPKKKSLRDCGCGLAEGEETML